MFIVHKKSLVKDGNNPTYLYGYARKVIEEGGRRRAEGVERGWRR
jgi:hypothetical protein